VRFGLPIIRCWQRRRLGPDDAAAGRRLRLDRLAATELTYTRYDKVVERSGSRRILRAPEEIRPALDQRRRVGKPAL